MNVSAADRCGDCGWTVASGPCPACGAVPRRAPQAARADVDPAALLAVHEEDFPALRDAFAAYRAKDWARFVGTALAAIGVDRAYAVSDAQSQSWAFRRGSAVIIVGIEKADQSITIDAPIVDIRPETEVPLLRAALSAGARLGIARPARRGDKLLLTVTQRLAAMPPPRLCLAVDEVARAADELDNVFAAEFGVRLLGPQMRKGHVFDLDVAGKPRRLSTVTAASRPVTLQRGVAPAPAGTPGGAAAVSAQHVAAFLDVVREQQQITLGFRFAPIDDNLEAAFHYAGACRAALASGPAFDAAQVLLRAAHAARVRQAAPSSLRVLYERLLSDRGATAAQAPFSLPRIPATRVKQALATHLSFASTAGTTALRRAILLGALAEVVIAADLPAANLEKIREMHDSQQGTDTRSVDALLQMLQGLAR